ncbi:MAG: TIGR00730 family Rossman fold protein [Ilumatobacter sp.]|jgi:uncharacterized protein (TIGR00730 family)|uniref:LOG family protein n=1 Tax=Ilumatobacter sp. TaxID=1967498 RepID=UPI00391AAB4D
MAAISVFCGSSAGSSPVYREAAAQLGIEIAQGGHRLIFGGGRVGLMGAVADAAMTAGGTVTGIITEQLEALEVSHDTLSELEVVVDMHTRKARMAALSDAVIVLPGGFGTCDEAFEILTWNQLGIVSVPVVFFDVDGFYEPLFAFIEGAVEAGFMKPDHGALAQRVTTAADAVFAATAPAKPFTPKWVT